MKDYKSGLKHNLQKDEAAIVTTAEGILRLPQQTRYVSANARFENVDHGTPPIVALGIAIVK